MTFLPPNAGQPEKTNASFNRFQFDGYTWNMEFEDKRISRPNMPGLRYLRLLVKAPHKMIASSHLILSVNSKELNYVLPAHALDEMANDENPTCGSKCNHLVGTPADQMADARTLKEVRSALRRLQAELDASQANDPECVVNEIKTEIAKYRTYQKELSFKWQQTKFTSVDDKNRKSVYLAIHRAIESIVETHPSLGKHLRNAVKTGHYCSYEPSEPTKWVI